ncbi:testis-expressed protein 11 isoform X1 [Hydra vulgaris]|uniref:testis-expressed protein 11 isoform X1 n=1 Tax=Hydra vulgaris TaxID=6087 RepID=UPI001F5FCE90|nr:testis-expressed protein 11-like [Hydra vulgaris]
MSSFSIFNKIEGLVAEFESPLATENQLEKISCNLLSALEELKSFPKIKDGKHLLAIHTMGVKLWNLVVTKNISKYFSALVSVRVRHMALHLTFLANVEDESQSTLRKHQAMALKVGKDWLDCNNLNDADACFKLSTECYLKLHQLLKVKQSSLSEDKIDETHKNMLKVFAFRAEIALNQHQYVTAFEFFYKAKELLIYGSEQASFLSSVCYNFGLDCYQKDLYNEAERWLRESILIGVVKDREKKQVIAEQLLVMVYFAMGGIENLKKGLVVIESSLKSRPCVKTIFLKVKLLLSLSESDDIILEALMEMTNELMCDIDLVLQCVSLFSEKKREGLSEKALDILVKQSLRPTDNIKVLTKRLEVFLSTNQILKAKENVKELLYIVGPPIDRVTLKRLQLLLWEQAQNSFSEANFQEAQWWYEFALKFMQKSSEDKVNLAKLQRNLCACEIELQLYEKALETAEKCCILEPLSPQIHFLIFKIQLNLNEFDKAILAIEKLSVIGAECNSLEIVCGLINLAAQLAFESGNKMLSEFALEKLIDHVKDPQQALVSLRCLTRLKFTNLSQDSKMNEIENVLKLVEKALTFLEVLSKNPNADIHEETIWFNKIAWNLALSCSNYYLCMHGAFTCCYKLSLLLPQADQSNVQQKTCLLMAAGCSLQLARDNKNDMIMWLETVLQLVYKCYAVIEKLHNIKDTSLNFLLGYEFEAKARLGHTDLEMIVDKALQISGLDPRVFENFANVSFMVFNGMSEIGIKCIKLAIKNHLEKPIIDFTALSKNIHCLINVSLQFGSLSNPETKEDAYSFYEDTLKVIDSLEKGKYPEMEIVWLMTKAWNCGIHLYTANHFPQAERWCTLSMKFLKYLLELKNSYEPHMTRLFADVISGIQQSQVHSQPEE